jgi:ketosteroid isomerase-like protein
VDASLVICGILRAMSEESTTPDLVERMRRMLDFFGDGGIDAVMPFYAPDAVWDLSDAGIGVYEGAEAIRRFMEDWTGSFDDYVFEVEEVLDLSYGVVLLTYRDSGRPAGGEGRVEQQHTIVGLWVGGKIERVTSYRDSDEARAVAAQADQSRSRTPLRDRASGDRPDIWAESSPVSTASATTRRPGSRRRRCRTPRRFRRTVTRGAGRSRGSPYRQSRPRRSPGCQRERHRSAEARGRREPPRRAPRLVLGHRCERKLTPVPASANRPRGRPAP